MAYNVEQEYIEIKQCFEELLELKPAFKIPKNEELIRKAFSVAYEGHKETRRKSGEPYIYHPIAVARIVVEEIGLGTTSLIAALLHDVVEDTDFTLENIKNLFGEKIAIIVDGLTKIKGTVNNADSIQSETLRKIILTLSEDLRVIMIKLADRLHNLRTIGAMPEHKKLRSIAETQYLYAPLAHRLGLYVMKTELENLCFYHTNREEYEDIEKKINQCYVDNKKALDSFIENTQTEINKLGISFEIFSRTKSIFSIWRKIHKKGIEFDEVFDLLAIRIIYDSQSELSPEEERAICWRIFSVITSRYKPKPDRIRDWISQTKANGYEALHATFMSENASWIEVQIRSRRMHEIAEKGIAAHWKYKTKANKQNTYGVDELDKWLNDIKDFLSTPDENTQEFLDVFKLNLYSDEIYTFTPKGQIITLPKSSTALDFAYEIHTDIGNHCLAAKINKELKPKNTTLKNGDLVEILTSEKEKPKIEWLDVVKSAKAKTQINYALKDVKREKTVQGKEIFDKILATVKEKYSPSISTKILNYFKLNSENDFFIKLAEGVISLDEISEAIAKKRPKKIVSFWSFKSKKSSIKKTIDVSKETAFQYETSQCCNPIPGDEVMGFMEDNNISIHKVDCKVAIDRMSRDAKSIVKVYWNRKSKLAVLATINVEGTDRRGIFQKIAEVISKDFKVTMRSINIDVKDGVFKGKIDLYVQDINHVNDMISKLVKISGVEKVNRVFDNI
jgi:GTP pyrophosphokinase